MSPALREIRPYVETGDVVAGYTIEDCIGEGIIMRVYTARDKDGNYVVVKFVCEEYVLNYDVFDMVLMEEDVLTAVNHPHLPKHIARGVHHGIPYLVQEYCAGRNLRQYPKKQRFALGLYPPLFVARMAYMLCDALTALHTRGIVHRDIKPHNILVSGTHGARHVTLIDFGGAQFVGRKKRSDRSRNLAGTPIYMSPETARREPGTPQSDIFSTGATIYQLCYDVKGPYQIDPDLAVTPENLEMVLAPIRRGEVCPPRFQIYPYGLRDVVIKATHPDPAQRYSSAQDLKQALYPFTLKYPT